MKNRNGNALFIILAAISLLGALSYAIVYTSRGSGSNADRERVQLQASQIIQQATSWTLAAKRLKTVHDCADNEISFENPIMAGYTNPNAPANKRCHIFDPRGGQMILTKPPADMLDSAHSGDTFYGWWIASDRNLVLDVPADANFDEDLIFIFPYIKEKICQAINHKLWGTSMAAEPPRDMHGYQHFLLDGVYGQGTGYIGQEIAGDFNYRGEYAGCFESLGGATDPPLVAHPYVFYQVMIAR